MEAIEKFEHAGYTVSIHYDDDPMSPADWDTLGIFAHWHRNYTFGNENIRDADFMRKGPVVAMRYLTMFENAVAIIPVGMYDHSGISFYEGTGASRFDSGGWDSGWVGFIYTTRERCELLGVDYTDVESVENSLRAELESWNEYVTGQVYGYVIEDSEGNHVDSCWGFYGMGSVVSEAKEMAEWNRKDEEKQTLLISRAMAL